jgi:cytochrome c-type biogenesis protein CcmH
VALLAVLLLAVPLLSWWVPARAVEPQEKLPDAALETRAEAIGRTLRCLVCQNESIEESAADLAHDLRVLLRQRLVAGDTDAQAVQFIVARYGDFVLLKPPVEPATYLLWFGPPALLLVGAVAIALAASRRRSAPEPPPLTDTERERLDRLAQEMEG